MILSSPPWPSWSWTAWWDPPSCSTKLYSNFNRKLQSEVVDFLQGIGGGGIGKREKITKIGTFPPFLHRSIVTGTLYLHLFDIRFYMPNKNDYFTFLWLYSYDYELPRAPSLERQEKHIFKHIIMNEDGINAEQALCYIRSSIRPHISRWQWRSPANVDCLVTSHSRNEVLTKNRSIDGTERLISTLIHLLSTMKRFSRINAAQTARNASTLCVVLAQSKPLWTQRKWLLKTRMSTWTIQFF